ncbi:tetratricopeptide repeat protein [Marinobacter sp. BW6]|uniref:tetratricopeptide repeat protein n=1 Tax=Marinobacter sp. BW6 TaxID=2592624 RepID=UPI0011DECC25|nr:tetratricopeptide repeat protein [Marinobacter sp. BW6]TYC63833.1 tetratricopeptide repeat protein [Marinobacter sp. BW6]
MSDDRLSNLGKDLLKAKQQALLIEVLQSDLDSWVDQSPNPIRVVCDASSAVYDVCVKDGKTNVLVVGEGQGQGPLSIFGCLLGSLDNEFDDLHKREILKKLAGFGLNQALGGVVSEAVGDSLSVGAGQMMEYLAEFNGSASDVLTSAVEAGVESVADESGEIVGDIGGTGAEAIAGQFSSEDSIYLSPDARKRLKELAPRLSDKATSHETLQLALEMLLVTALGAPKVIVVNDPFRLDDASLALLAMLVSLEKDLRQVAHADSSGQGRAKTVGISVVLTFTGAQLNDTVVNKGMADKQQAISRLRMMASRYSLLERLDSDIPVPAVRASTFVGRNQELESLRRYWKSLCEQPDTASNQTWCLIRGEPGTGKTALANQFIDKIRSDTAYPERLSIPTLRLLNQTGHSAQATGLASLKNSMADELRRLTLVYRKRVGWLARSSHQITEGVQSWKDDATSDDPEAIKRMQGRVAKMVSKLLGIDAVMGVAGSVKGWSKQDEMRSMRKEEFGQSYRANHKEEQFELLRASLLEIRKLAEKCSSDSESQPRGSAFPLLLLVDDLQWVDDFTAEFLLKEWPADVPVYILATARGSDSFTTTGESSEHQALNWNRNRLFTELGLIHAGSVDVERDHDEEQEKEGKQIGDLALVSCLELKGMDQPMLAKLIKLTYGDITKEQAEQFAAAVTNNLSGANNASEIITLFAIETLNVISDPQFYRRNPELPRLIESLPDTNRYRFNEPESGGLTEALNRVFRNLRETYQASYLIETGRTFGGERFNLSSYAVLEERLHLIEQYFGEYGGTARYSLLFSAVLGSPFRIELVEQLLRELIDLPYEDYPELYPLTQSLRERCRHTSLLEQYEVLERAYEIVWRIRDNTNLSIRYSHQHDLLSQFLAGQFTQRLFDLYSTPDKIDESLKNIVAYLWVSGESWFDNWNEKFVDKLAWEEVHEIEKARFRVALTGYRYRVMMDLTSHLGDWAKEYVLSLNYLATETHVRGELAAAMVICEEALSISRLGHSEDPDYWAEGLAISLNNLAAMREALGRPEVAILSHTEAHAIIESNYRVDEDRWAEWLITNLGNQAMTFDAMGMPEEALPKQELALSILERHYKQTPKIGEEFYASNVDNLASIFQSLGKHEDALPKLELALAIRETLYKTEAHKYSEDYVRSLNNLALTLDDLDDLDGALQRYDKALEIIRPRLESAPDRWAIFYTKTLTNSALALKPKNPRKALVRYLEAISVIRDGYDEAPERWEMQFATCLHNLGSTYQALDRYKDAMKEYSTALEVIERGFSQVPERWDFLYVSCLHKKALALGSLNQPEDALLCLEKALPIIRSRSEKTPTRWREHLIFNLTLQAKTFEALNRAEDCLAQYDELVWVFPTKDEEDRERWRDAEVASWLNYARALRSFGRVKDAISTYEHLLPYARKGYKERPELWEASYLYGLRELADILMSGHSWSEASSLLRELVSALQCHRDADSDHMVKNYAAVLADLAFTLCTDLKMKEALGLYEEALSIRESAYEKDPENWAINYVENLNNTAFCHEFLGNFESARLLREKAQSIDTSL